MRPKATLGVDKGQFDAELDRAREQVEAVGRQRPTILVTADTAPAIARLRELDGRKLSPKELQVQAKIVKALSDIDKVGAKLDELARKKADPKIDANIEAAERRLRLLDGELRTISERKTGVELEIETARVNRQIDEVKLRLEELRAVRPNIDIEIRAAEAKLAMLNAQLATLSQPLDAASASMGTFQRYALLAAAATPLISAGIIALPGLISAAVVPAAAVAVGLDGIKASAAGLATQFDGMKRAVSDTFAGSLQPAISNVAALIPTLTTGLQGTASALGVVASEVTGVVSSAAGMQQVNAIFAQVNQIISGLAPSIGLLTQNFMGLAQIGLAGLQPLGAMLTEVGTRWQELITDLQQTGVGQAAVSALVSVLGGLLDIIPPLVSAGAQVMAVLGPPLAGALQVTASILSFLTGPLGTVTTTVIAGVAAWKALQLVMTGIGAAGARVGQAISSASTSLAGMASSGSRAEAMFSKIASSTGAAAGGLGGVRTGASGAAAATERAAGSSGRLGGALSKIGNALPVIGAGFVALQTIVDATTVSTDQAAQAQIQGGQAAMTMSDAVAHQTVNYGQYLGAVGSAVDAASNWFNANILGVATTDSVSDAVKRQRDSMTDLQRAQSDATAAQNNYNTVVGLVGSSSGAATVFMNQYQEAMDRVNQAQQQAARSALTLSMQNAATHFGPDAAAADQYAQSTKNLADAYTKLADPMSTATEKASAFTDAFKNASDPATQLAVSTQKVNDAMRELPKSVDPASARLIGLNGTIDTTSEAGSKLQTAVLNATGAIQGSFGASVAAAQGQQNMGQAVGNASAKFEQQKQSLVDSLVQQGANRASAEALVNTLLKVPAGISTQFQTPGAVQATAEALGLKNQIVATPNDKTVVVKSLTAEARQQLTDLGLQVIDLPNGQVEITADTGQAQSQVNAFITGARANHAQVMIDGQTMPAEQAYQSVLSQIKAGKAEINIDGRTVPAMDALAYVLSNANMATGTVTIAGQSAPAQTVLQSLIQAANTGSGTVTINGQSLPAQAVLQSLLAQVSGVNPQIPLGMNPAPAQSTLNNTVAQTNNTKATMLLDASNTLVAGKIEQVVTLANGAVGTVTIDGNQTPVDGKIQGAIRTATGARGVITIDGNQVPVDGKVQASVQFANGAVGTITLNANDLVHPAITGNQAFAAGSPAAQPVVPGPNGVPPVLAGNQGLAGGALAGQPIAPSSNTMPGAILGNQGLAAGSPATQPINGNNALFRGQVISGVAFANGSTGTIRIDGNPSTANGKTTAAVRFADGSRGTITIDGNQSPADGKVTATVRRADGSTGTIRVDANAGGANSAIDNAARPRTAVITVVARGSAVGMAVARAEGAYAMARDLGALAEPAAYATGGLRPMSAARAEIVPPNQPRIIGDRMRGDEAFIPINRSARSEQLLALTAQRMGYAVTPLNGGTSPQGMADGSLFSAATTPGRRPAAQVGDGQPLTAVITNLTQAADRLGASILAILTQQTGQGAATAASSARLDTSLQTNTVTVTGNTATVNAATARQVAAIGQNVLALAMQAAAMGRHTGVVGQSIGATAGLTGASYALGGTMNNAAASIAASARSVFQAADQARASAAAAAASAAQASAARAAAARPSPPPDDDSFESNSYYSPHRGQPGYVQAEDGSWVKKSFYRAAGGIDARRSLPAGHAAIAGPRSLRAIIGDRSVDDEAYIPINRSTASLALLTETAARMGWDLIKHSDTLQLGSSPPSRDLLTSDPTPLVSAISRVTIPTQQGATSLQPVIAELQQLRATIAALRGPGNTFTVNNYVDQAAQAADETVRSLRKQAALGLFGGD